MKQVIVEYFEIAATHQTCCCLSVVNVYKNIFWMGAEGTFFLITVNRVSLLQKISNYDFSLGVFELYMQTGANLSVPLYFVMQYRTFLKTCSTSV